MLIAANDELCDGSGERIAWPAALGADRAYRADWIDDYLQDLDIQPVIPARRIECREAAS